MITVSWQSPDKLPNLPVHETETRDAIRRKLKVFEDLQFTKVEPIVRIDV